MSDLSLEDELSLSFIYTLLDFTNTEYVIAGGFPRDLYFGLTPKDIDVFIHFDDYIQVERTLEHSPFQEKFKVWDADDMKSSKPWYKNLVNVEKVIKPMWGWDIDLIFINRDLKDTVNTFDHNINQFVLEGTKPVYKGTHSLDRLVQLNNEVTDARKAKMQKKFLMIQGVS